MIEFNMNDYIHVKLTQAGHEELKRQHIAFLGEKWPYIPPAEDEEGYSRWQMWDIMNKLGELLANGVEPAFMPVIKIEIKKELKMKEYKSCPYCGCSTSKDYCPNCFYKFKKEG